MAPILPYLLESNVDPENIYEQEDCFGTVVEETVSVCHGTNMLVKQLFFFVFSSATQPGIACRQELLYLNKQQCVEETNLLLESLSFVNLQTFLCSNSNIAH